jgi:death on curing protein
MATQTLYPTLAEVLYLHRRLIERFGGGGGVRDAGLLESALHRPRSGYYGSLSEQAAALLQSLARNHAFVDGNKRVAFATCAVFLRMNGFKLAVDADAAEAFLVGRVIEGQAELAEITAWLEGVMAPALG